MPGKVDIEALKKRAAASKQHARGNLLRTDEGVSVVDRVALRKSWANKGRASYWIDVICCPKGRMSVLGFWRWYDKNKGEWVEGEKRFGRTTTSELEIRGLFVEAINKMLDRDYIIDERSSVQRSPVGDIEFKNASAKSERDMPTKTKKTPVLMQGKRGTHDWW